MIAQSVNSVTSIRSPITNLPRIVDISARSEIIEISKYKM